MSVGVVNWEKVLIKYVDTLREMLLSQEIFIKYQINLKNLIKGLLSKVNSEVKHGMRRYDLAAYGSYAYRLLITNKPDMYL